MDWKPFTLAITVLAVALSGCTSTGHADHGHDDLDSNPYHSFEEAVAAVGEEFAIGTATLKVLEPTSHTGAQVGENRILVLFYNDQGPITDADIRLKADMPAMGHGTENTNPMHDAYGVYVARADLFMPGEWELEFEVRLTQDQLQPDYAVATIQVAKADGDGDGHTAGEHGSNA